MCNTRDWTQERDAASISQGSYRPAYWVIVFGSTMYVVVHVWSFHCLSDPVTEKIIILAKALRLSETIFSCLEEKSG